MVYFHGVSTKHLPSYLGWMGILDTQKELGTDDIYGSSPVTESQLESFHT